MLIPEQQASDETTPIAQLRELAGQSIALARLVAGNFSADSELLRTLAAHDDRVVQQLVAANPNVPLDLLERFVKRYPIQVLNNPAIDLFLLEKPDLLVGLSLKDVTVRALIKRSLASSKFLDYAAKLSDEKINLAIAMNPYTPKDILERLMTSKTVYVVEAAQMHINWSEIGKDDWRLSFQKALAKIQEQDRKNKIESKNCLVMSQMEFKAISLEEVNSFMNLIMPCTTQGFQANQDTPGLIKKLEKIKKLRVSLKKLRSSIGFTILIILISPLLVVVTLAVWLERLLASSHNVNNRYHSPEITPNLSARQLDELMWQTEEYLKTVAGFDRIDGMSPLAEIARHPNISPTALRQLLLHEDDHIQRVAFENPKTLQLIEEYWGCEVLHKMNSSRLYGLALQPTTSESILAMLVQHHNESVCIAAALNSCAGGYVLKQWQKSLFYNGDLEYRLEDKEIWSEEWLAEWVALPTDSRFTILTHPKVPIGILAKAFRSDWWVERCAIAQNPSTPRSIHQRLAEDGNWVVRAAARETLSR